MRYYKFSAAERKLVMAEAEPPEPGPGQVRVRVAAARLNYRDVFMVSRFGDVGIDNRIPLSDASGAIDAVGYGATRFRVGDRVATTTILSKTFSLALKRKTPTGWRRFSIRMSSFSTMATPKFGGKMPCARRGTGCSAILARCDSKPCIKR